MRTVDTSTTGEGRGARPKRAALLVACAGLIFWAGCRDDMYAQPKYEPYEPSAFFKDGTSSRPIPAGTVARGQLRASSLYYEGKVDGNEADVFPFPITEEIIQTGQDRYMVFCTPCHGRLGNGKGMVVRRGFSPPPDLHSDYLKKAPVGHFFNVITHGHGAMYSYEARIPVQHRWAIAAYIRALQYSQDASPDDLSAEERKELARAAEATPSQPVADSSSQAEVKK